MTQPDDGVIPAFQQRRKHMLKHFGFSLLLFVLALVLMQIGEALPDLLGLGRRGWTTAAAVQMIAGVVFALVGFLQYRCPACGNLLRGHDRYWLGVLIDPDKCPKCGVRLKE